MRGCFKANKTASRKMFLKIQRSCEEPFVSQRIQLYFCLHQRAAGSKKKKSCGIKRQVIMSALREGIEGKKRKL